MRSGAHFWLVDIKIVEKMLTIETQFWLVAIKFVENSMTLEARFWLVDIKKDKNFLKKILVSDWLILEFLKAPWLDWMIMISARLHSVSILIFSHVKNNWLISLLFLFTFLHVLSYSTLLIRKIWDTLYLPFILKFVVYFLRCRHWIEMKELHVLNVAENCNFFVRTVTFILIAAWNSLIISRRSIVNLMSNYMLGSLYTHSKIR